MVDLFDLKSEINKPLADRMKPTKLDEFVGQNLVLGKGSHLRHMIENDCLGSIILYGPPGSGKTSVATIVASNTKADFIKVNATTSGIKDIKAAIDRAIENRKLYSKKTIIFIDEIHRFNKLQQDALLSHVENGDIVLIGATTENPYFEVNSALISRANVFRFNALTEIDILKILKYAMEKDSAISQLDIQISDEVLNDLAILSNGDARRALGVLEMAANKKAALSGSTIINREDLQSARKIIYSKTDSHYDSISAFIKSMRGSDADAAVYYLALMLVGGEDPNYIARRITICASEDVGNADPQALVIANSAMHAIRQIGMPEARIILSQAAIYVANAPKSNACYTAINKAMADVQEMDTGEIPYYLRDGTSLKLENKNSSEVGEKAYKYPHDYPENYVEQQYLPDKIKDRKYYGGPK